MKKPHKHAELIKAWADGAEIQIKVEHIWEDARPNFLVWNDEYEYRIKPAPKPDVVATFYFVCDLEHQHVSGMKADLEDSNVKLVFDGETGELKSAEVLI